MEIGQMVQFRSLEPFGAAVDLPSATLSTAEVEQLRRRFAEDGLLVVRGLRLSQAEQIAFCRHFGPVHKSPSENFIVSNVEQDGLLGTRELLWHNDVSYLPSPYLGASLHALKVDPGAVGTRFVSGFRAWERLPAGLRRRIDGIKALHVRERVFDRTNRLTDLIEGDMCTVHDAVRIDPATGRRYLFVNQAWTALIIGLPDAEGRALQDELSGHFYAEGEIYEHRWAEGDLVIWNNLAVQHSRGETGGGARTLQRVTIAELGYEQQYPTDMRAIYEGLHNDALLETQA
jgi:taurine dioxygenase